MRVVRWVSGLLWMWSWYTMSLEIFRWRHVTSRLRFNQPPPLPGTGVSPRPGWPPRMVFGCFLLAPVVFLATLVVGPRRVGGQP